MIPGDQLTLIDCVISREDKIACLTREVIMRETLYAKWVEQGKMKRATADREIAVMKSILADYHREQYPLREVR